MVTILLFYSTINQGNVELQGGGVGGQEGHRGGSDEAATMAMEGGWRRGGGQHGGGD